MNRMIVFALALALGLGASAAKQPDAAMQAKIKAARERVAAMSPKEREAFRWKMAMKRFGGFVTKEGSGAGRVAFVNTTKKVETAFVARAIAEIEDLLECRMVAVSSDAKVTVATADKELLRTKAEAAIFLVEDPSLPTMLVAPESDWAIINVTALSAGQPDEKKFLFRVEKELWRTFGHLCGAADSSMGGCVLSPVNTIDDLDALTGKFICPEPMNSLHRHLEHIGVKPYVRTTYLDACREGWAHQPTNEYQKAIWDKVHQAPTAPIVIKPEPAKKK